MQEDRYARYGAAAGIVFLILLVVGFFVYGADIPDTDAAAEEWATWYADNTGQIQTAVTLVGVSLFFFIWFLGSVRSALAAAEGGTGRLSSVAYGGGLVAAGFFVVFLTAVAAAALHADEVDPFVIQGLNDLGIVAAAPAAAAFTALFAAAAIVGYRHAALPPAASGLAALAAIGQPFAYGTAVTDSGAFAGDGFLGLWVPVVTFVVGILALSVALIRQPVPQPSAP